MMKTTASALAVGVTLLLVLAAGCGSLAPYDDGECEPCDEVCKDDLLCERGRCIDPEDPYFCAESSALCAEYCRTVMDTCPENYATYENCLGVCEQLPPGDFNEPGGNTVACRLNAAHAASHVDPLEREQMCQAAGPGGNGACGTNCESYCWLAERVCGEVLASLRDCQATCEALGDSERFSVGNSPGAELDHSGDTVQCRLVHLSSAAADSQLAEVHCP